MLFGLLKSLDDKVKEDRERLISKLKSCDIKTLIIEMGNNNPISNNIIKKQQGDKSFESQDYPSWFAYRVSDELKDITLKPELIQLLSERDFLKYKPYVLRCLSSLCANTSDYELFDFLMLELKKSNKNEIITTVLGRLNKLRKPSTLNIDFLKHLLLNGTYQNRIDAINALGNSEHGDLEDILIQEFKKSDVHTKGMISSNLGATGTKKCIDILKTEHKRTRSNNLKCFIEMAIEEINKRENASSQHAVR